jgi:F0F1-type ATP synthase assembly protein I
VDHSQRRALNREINNGAGDALSRAFELTLTPVILGAVGWFLDARFGTRPWIALTLFAFTIGYLAWKFYVRYDADMREQERRLLAPRTERHDAA